MRISRKFVIGLLVGALILIADQLSKYYVFSLLDETVTRTIEVTGFFNLVEVYNTGVSFGLFDKLPYGQVILAALAIAIILILVVWMSRITTLWLSFGLGLIIGGAIGNVIDRVQIGAVKAFLDFYVAGYHWPAFNVADSAVCIGVVMLLLDGIINKESK